MRERSQLFKLKSCRFPRKIKKSASFDADSLSNPHTKDATVLLSFQDVVLLEKANKKIFQVFEQFLLYTV